MGIPAAPRFGAWASVVGFVALGAVSCGGRINRGSRSSIDTGMGGSSADAGVGGASADAGVGVGGAGTDAGAGGAGTDAGAGCLPGTVRCNGQQPQGCDAHGQWQDQGAACSSSQLCQTGSGNTCKSACKIGGSFYQAGETASNNPCQICQPTASTSAWTSLADGAQCGNGQVCTAGLCGTHCTIGGTVYKTGAVNPGNPCQGCQPGLSTSAWTTLAIVCNVALVSGQAPVGIAVDSTNVYWTNDAYSGAVMKMPISGGTPTTLASGLSYPEAIAVDSTSVYWTEAARVMKAPIAGGTPITLDYSVMLNSTSIAVDSTSVYWSLSDGVLKLPLSGGTPTTLAYASGTSVIAVDSSSVYWAHEAVKKVALAGGTPTTLFPGPGEAQGIAVDSKSVYWTDAAHGTVMKVALSGGAPTTLASNQNGPFAIAVDSTGVYWTNRPLGPTPVDGSVETVPLSGGIPRRLASGRPYFIALDSTSVYWTDPTAIMRAPK